LFSGCSIVGSNKGTEPRDILVDLRCLGTETQRA